MNRLHDIVKQLQFDDVPFEMLKPSKESIQKQQLKEYLIAEIGENGYFQIANILDLCFESIPKKEQGKRRTKEYRFQWELLWEKLFYFKLNLISEDDIYFHLHHTEESPDRTFEQLKQQLEEEILKQFDITVNLTENVTSNSPMEGNESEEEEPLPDYVSSDDEDQISSSKDDFLDNFKLFTPTTTNTKSRNVGFADGKISLSLEDEIEIRPLQLSPPPKKYLTFLFIVF